MECLESLEKCMASSLDGDPDKLMHLVVHYIDHACPYWVPVFMRLVREFRTSQNLFPLFCAIIVMVPTLQFKAMFDYGISYRRLRRNVANREEFRRSTLEMFETIVARIRSDKCITYEFATSRDYLLARQSLMDIVSGRVTMDRCIMERHFSKPPPGSLRRGPKTQSLLSEQKSNQISSETTTDIHAMD